MEQGTGLKTLRAIDGVSSAESAPTTASSWVNLVDEGGNQFGKARVFFGEPTLGNADNACVITIWGRQGSKIFPIDQATMDTGTDLFSSLNLGVCPPSWSFYATVDTISGTTAEVTVDVSIMRYTDDS